MFSYLTKTRDLFGVTIRLYSYIVRLSFVWADIAQTALNAVHGNTF